MNRAMVHRGPDSDGFLDDGTLALGIRRLRIIDLGTGDQPIFNEDRSVAVVFNGEIYNFQELYQELKKLGHSFATSSDTEIIVHAYEEWGKECLHRLRGMFAFAVWDCRPADEKQPLTHTRRLLLVRDRLGIKPLYIWRNGKKLLFASEARAILSSGVCPRRLSAAGLYTYLAFGSVQEPLTIIDGITTVPPGSWLQVDLARDEWKVTSGSYWQPSPNGNLDPASEDVRAWLADAVQSHLISEVPLGSFLSGGLDSGAIVALASQVQKHPTRTFTLAFDNWPHDERDRANLTAEHCHTDHRHGTQTEVS
jgi:asparagine synthase (glutamine-hydrolysing)